MHSSMMDMTGSGTGLGAFWDSKCSRHLNRASSLAKARRTVSALIGFPFVESTSFSTVLTSACIIFDLLKDNQCCQALAPLPLCISDAKHLSNSLMAVCDCPSAGKCLT